MKIKKSAMNGLAIAMCISIFSGCSISMGSLTSASSLPCKAPTVRAKTDLTKKIERAMNDSKDLDDTCIYADMDENKIKLSGLVQNEKQKYTASLIANSLSYGKIVVNRVDIYRPVEQPKAEKTTK